MVKYSFYSSRNGYVSSRNDVLDLFKTTNKPIKYTYGYKYKNPTTYMVQISNDEAIHIFNRNSLSDVVEYEDYVDLNCYSDNDMW